MTCEMKEECQYVHVINKKRICNNCEFFVIDDYKWDFWGKCYALPTIKNSIDRNRNACSLFEEKRGNNGKKYKITF